MALINVTKMGGPVQFITSEFTSNNTSSSYYTVPSWSGDTQWVTTPAVTTKLTITPAPKPPKSQAEQDMDWLRSRVKEICEASGIAA